MTELSFWIVSFTLLHLFDYLDYQLLCSLHAASEPKLMYLFIGNWIKRNTDSDDKMLNIGSDPGPG